MEDVNLGAKETSTAISQTKVGVEQLRGAVQRLSELV
jgi:hypothetical protein